MRIQLRVSGSINVKDVVQYGQDDPESTPGVDIKPVFYANRKETPVVEMQVFNGDSMDYSVYLLMVKPDGKLSLVSMGRPIEPAVAPAQEATN